MKTRKEGIEQLCYAISGWIKKRGHYTLNKDEKEFDRADKIIDYWIEHLEKYIKAEPINNKT